MRNGKHTIRRKITALLLCMVTVSILLSGAVSLWGLLSMKRLSADSSRRLGQTAAEDAERALESLAVQNLQAVAKERASSIEGEFQAVAAYVRGIAAMTKNVYEHPEQYPERQTPLPVQGSHALAPQLMWSEALAARAGGGAQPDFIPPLTEEILKLGNVQDFLVQCNAHNDMVSSTYVATKSGWVIQADYIAANKYQGGGAAPDYFDAERRQWFQRAVYAAEGGVVYSDVLRDISGGGNCIVCASPVFVKGKLVAVAGVGSYLDTVNEAVLNTVIGKTGYAFLIGKKGQILVSPKKAGETAATAEKLVDIRRGENAQLAAIAGKLLLGDSGAERILLDGADVYLAYAPLESLGWGLVTVMDVGEALAPAWESQGRILSLAEKASESQGRTIQEILASLGAVMAAALLLICLAGAVFSKKLTDPVHTLAYEVARIDGGNLDVPIRLETGDEVEEVACAFNKMAVQMKAYMENLAVAAAEQEHIRTELSMATAIQADMLPDSGCALREWEALSLYASMTPAKEVGGDFYDFFPLDENHLALIIADVSGKGVPAALFMVVAKTLLRSLITGSGTLAEAVSEANRKLCDGNQNGMFVTAWIGILDLSSGELFYVSAGHNPPLLGSREKGMAYVRQSSGPVLAAMEDTAYRLQKLRMLPGDTLFLYTDGVTEANDVHGNLYGEERLSELLNASEETTPERLATAVHRDLWRFQGEAEQFDDITMLVVRYNKNKKKGEAAEEARAAALWRRNIGPAELSRLASVQDFVEKAFVGEQGAAEWLYKLLIALDEIFSNICRHSNAVEVAVECGMEGHRALLIIEDNGKAFNPLTSPKPDVAADVEKREPGGLGIYMVKQMIDQVDYERTDGKNRLTMAIRG